MINDLIGNLTRETKRFRGGIRQRESASSSGRNTTKSELALELMEEYGFGYLSAVHMQEFVVFAYNGGLRDSFLSKNAACGTWGKYQKEVSADFKDVNNDFV